MKEIPLKLMWISISMEQMENILLQVIVSPQDLSKYSSVLDGYFTNQPFFVYSIYLY